MTIGGVLSEMLVKWIVGGETEAESKKWKLDDIANTVGGEG